MLRRHKRVFLIILCLALLLPLTSCQAEETKQEKIKYSSINDLHNVKFGLETGSAFDGFVKEYYPDCEVSYFSSPSDRYLSIEEGKVVAFWLDTPKIKSIVKEKENLYYLTDDRFISPLAFAFSMTENGTKLQKQMNELLNELREDGTLDELCEKWVDNSAIEAVGDEGLENINGEINVMLNSNNQPFIFIYNNHYTGIEYDILVRFCRKYGYSLKISDSNLDETIAAVSFKKSDIGASGLTITDERKKSILFSDPYYYSKTSCLILKDNLNVEIDPLDYLVNKNIGVVSGSMHADVAKKYLPNANVLLFSAAPDMFNAVSLGKIDAALNDEVICELSVREFDNLYIAKKVDAQNYACMISKSDFGKEIDAKLSEYIRKIKQTGELDNIRQYWFNGKENKKFDFDNLSDKNGTVRVVALQDGIPFSYISNNEVVGFEVEIIYNFAKEYGYKIEMIPLNVDAEIAYLSSGKADVCLGGYVITPEREQKFNFSEIIYVGSNTFVMKNNDISEEISIFEEIKNSLYKTFVVEDRYLLFVDGIKSTTLITLVSVLFGTIFGVILFSIYRLNNKIVKVVIDGLSWVIKSMPVVVLLMIMYYVVFSNSSIDGIWVSIFAFSLIFSIVVLGIFKTCFMAIDKGQYEACYALGYNKYQTFFKIILPQIGPMFIPTYRSEIISLIKSTSIVGYIAVQDLTKVSDIIRSRTFDAFFPLISTTIIYFAIMVVFTVLLEKIGRKIDPQKRNKEDILNGVVTHD